MGEPCLDGTPEAARMPHPVAQGRQHEFLETDHARYRIARQTEDNAAIFLTAEEQRMTGPHGDTPEVYAHLERFQCWPHMVVHADRGAAGNQQDIELQTATKVLLQLITIIAGDAEQHRFDTERLALGHQRVAVRVRNSVGVEWLLQPFQFIAGGQNGDARARIHRHLRRLDRRQQAHRTGRDFTACRQDDLPLCHAFATWADIVAATNRLVDLDAVSGQGLRVLDPDHRIGTRRHRRASHDPCGFPLTHMLVGQITGLDVIDHRQNGGETAQIGATQGITVHRRHIPGRQVTIGENIRRQHTPQRTFQRHGFHRSGLNMTQHDGLGVGYG